MLVTIGAPSTSHADSEHGEIERIDSNLINDNINQSLLDKLNSGEPMNEYDMYVEIKEELDKPVSQRSLNISPEKLDFVESGKLEKVILDKSKLSKEELKSMGMTIIL